MNPKTFGRISIVLTVIVIVYVYASVSDGRRSSDAVSLAASGNISENLQTYGYSSGSIVPILTNECIRKANLKKKYVAITFDDGPHAGYTRKLLRILREKETPATFFVVGSQAARFPEILNQQVAQGHEIGNHSYNHLDMRSMASEQIASELGLTGKLVLKITGRKISFFRPAGGNYGPKILSVASILGYRTVLWSVNSYDIKAGSAQDIVENTIRKISPGDIILLHDGVLGTLEALPEIIDRLRARGYSFVTLSGLLDQANDNLLTKTGKPILRTEEADNG